MQKMGLRALISGVTVTGMNSKTGTA